MAAMEISNHVSNSSFIKSKWNPYEHGLFRDFKFDETESTIEDKEEENSRGILIPQTRRNSKNHEEILVYDSTNLRNSQRVSTPSTDCPLEPLFRLSSVNSSSNHTSRCLSDFEFIERIGKGGYGEVFKVKNHLDGCFYALKRIKLGDDDNKNSRILREVSALSRLSHPHIVRYYQAWIEEGIPSPALSSSTNNEDDDNVDETSGFDDPTTDLDHHHLDLLRSSGSYSNNVLTCNVCDNRYMDWEVSLYDWKIISAGMQHLNLCQDCYKTQLKSKGLDVDQIKIMTKTPLPLYLYIQMEFCEKTLRAVIDDKSLWKASEPEKSIWSIFRQIAEATAYIHSHSCIHRDLKPGNIFFSADGTVKLGDFGLITGEIVLQEATNSIRRRTSQGEDQLPRSPSPKNTPTSCSPSTSLIAALLAASTTEEKTTAIGTAMYRSPELDKGRKYDEKIDMYSLGIILFEIWHPFNTGMERFVVLNELRNRRRLPKAFTQRYPTQSDLIYRLTQTDSSLRPTALELLMVIPMTADQSPLLQSQVSQIMTENIVLKSEMSQLKDTVTELKKLIEQLNLEKDQQQLEIIRLKKRSL